MSASETMKATADAWLTGFKHWDVEELVAPRADVCLHEIYPTTMGIPPSTNADFRAFFEPLKSFKNTETTVHAQIFDYEARSSWMHLEMTASTPVGPFHNEFIFMLFFDEQGDKIVRIREMMDSWYAKGFFAKMAEFAAAQQ